MGVLPLGPPGDLFSVSLSWSFPVIDEGSLAVLCFTPLGDLVFPLRKTFPFLLEREYDDPEPLSFTIGPLNASLTSDFFRSLLSLIRTPLTEK